MKQANRSGARYAVILGEDELAAHTALVRDMAESAQETCALDHLVEKIISEVKVLDGNDAGNETDTWLRHTAQGAGG